MSYNIDMAGTDLIVNTISTGASTPGAAGTALNAASVINSASGTYQTFTITGVNMNSATTDNAIAITLPAGKHTYMVEKCTVWNASHTIVTATASLYSAASAGGVAICADQALTPTSNTADTNLNAQNLTIASAGTTTCFTTATSLYFRVGTAEGAAATANVTLTIRIIG